MSEYSDRLIAKAQNKLQGLEAEVRKTKKFVNHLREFEGQSPLYFDVSAPAETPPCFRDSPLIVSS